MESLSWLFFCLSPFALFCSEGGNGLFLCPVFIILGFVFKLAGNNSGGTPTATVKVEPQQFWEWHYKDRMRTTLAKKDMIDDYQMSVKDTEARSWATTICGYHNAWVPPGERQEQIARSCGVITEKMIEERNINKDRIQIGKYFLMKKLLLKYSKDWCMEKEIKKDIAKIKISHHAGVDDWYVKQEYGKTVIEMCQTLSIEEKEQAVKWVREYEAKLIKAVKDYEERREFTIRNIDMDF